jgi:hypothetical protein
LLDVALDDIVDTITILQTQPRFETPEQYNKRTGKPWPDTWPVFFEYRENTNQYYVDKLEKIKNERVLKIGRVCVFTEAGPPPDDWKPKEETR